MKLLRGLTILGIAMLLEAYSPPSPPASCSQSPGATSTAGTTSNNTGSDTHNNDSTVTAPAISDCNFTDNGSTSSDISDNDTGYSYHANFTSDVSSSYNSRKHSSLSSHSSPSKTGTSGTSGTTGSPTNTSVLPTATALAITSDTSTPTPTATATESRPCPPPHSTTTVSGTFKGIYEFSGKNSSADANNVIISGTFLNYYWSKIEPQKGTFHWELLDQDMKPRVLVPDGSFLAKTSHLGETQVVDYAVSQNLWLQDNDMGAHRTLTSQRHLHVSHRST